MPVTLVLILLCSSGQPQVPDLLSQLPECWDKPAMAGQEGNLWAKLFTGQSPDGNVLVGTEGPLHL